MEREAVERARAAAEEDFAYAEGIVMDEGSGGGSMYRGVAIGSNTATAVKAESVPAALGGDVSAISLVFKKKKKKKKKKKGKKMLE